MGFYAARLRRATPLCSSLLHHHFHSPKIISPIHSIAPALSATLNPQTSGTSHLSGLQSFRLFRSSHVSLSSRKQRFDDEKEITDDSILFEGCDYNHWLITVDFPKDTPAEVKISTYERIAAQVFGSMEEAKKKMYACSTTVYNGFQVECSEETSEKFKDIPGVVFVLPDSYIDPVNKQYGGDKYINGEIIPMPPPINYMRRESRPRQRNENWGPVSGYGKRGQMQGETRNFGPPQQQNFGPPQNPPNQQNFGPRQNPPRQQSFGPPQNLQHQHNFGPPQNPPRQQYVGPPQNPSFQHNSGQQKGPVPQQNHPFPQNAPPHQNFGVQENFSPQQNSRLPGMRFPSQQTYTPSAGVGHKDSTISPGVWDHYEAGRTDFPQGDQTGYASANSGSLNPTSVPSESGSFGQDVAGATEKDIGPAYGHQNYPGHEEGQKFSKVEQSRI